MSEKKLLFQGEKGAYSHLACLEVFPDAEVMETPLADYRYRAWIERQAVSNAFTKQVEGLTYTNFKNSVKDKERIKPLMNVWQAMFDHQEAVIRRN